MQFQIPFFLLYLPECRNWIATKLRSSSIYRPKCDIVISNLHYKPAPYNDLHIATYSEGRMRTKLYNKREDFNFRIVNFPFVCGNIPTAPTYGVGYNIPVSVVLMYPDFLDRRELLLTRRLLNQAFLVAKLKISFRKFTVTTLIWLTVTECLSQITTICSGCRHHNTTISSFITSHRVRRDSNSITDVTSGAGTFGASPAFLWSSCCPIFSFLCSVL